MERTTPWELLAVAALAAAGAQGCGDPGAGGQGPGSSTGSDAASVLSPGGQPGTGDAGDPGDAGPSSAPVEAALDGAGAADTSAAPDGLAGGASLGAPPAALVNKAIADALVRYGRSLPGGAYTNAGNTGGASIILAVAAYEGDTSADARLLQQMRYTLMGNYDICANGGYPAQHELLVTGMYALARLTPRIFSQLSASEQSAVDTTMEASLIGSAFTTSDANPFIVAGTQEYTLDGDSNLSRDWNPNYREGMGGSVTVAAAYFGVSAASALLAGYNHAAFVARLQAAGLSNAHSTFTWKTTNPSSSAPTAAQIEAAVHSYAYHGHGLGSLLGYHQFLTDNTYSATVACGLNGGAGVSVGGTQSGLIAAGCSTLPNPGKVGMLLEFASGDAQGARSDSVYAYSGYKPNLITHLVLVASGLWQAGAVADDIVGKVKIGAADLWYKLDHGYHDYAHAMDYGVETYSDPAMGFPYLRSLWQDVLLPYHGG
jgi:hypothetical protein